MSSGNQVKKDSHKYTAAANKTNTTKNSLVKVVVVEDTGKWVSPPKGETYYIDEDGIFPEIIFELDSDDSGQVIWSWQVKWDAKVSGIRESSKRGKLVKSFLEKGTLTISEKKWKVDLNGLSLGGMLTVEAKLGNISHKRSIYIKGKNPSKQSVLGYLETLEDVTGFDAIIEQESKFKHFIDADHEPIVAFDKGFGMTQLTNPPSSYTQAWNWKENIKAGSKLFQTHQKAAKSYLGKKGRTYTDEQLKMETLSRWNGGAYHKWDTETNAWVRNENMLCDSKTGNIGWNVTLEENEEKTEEELHERDKDSYRNPSKKQKENKWVYTGVCYADHVTKE